MCFWNLDQITALRVTWVYSTQIPSLIQILHVNLEESKEVKFDEALSCPRHSMNTGVFSFICQSIFWVVACPRPVLELLPLHLVLFPGTPSQRHFSFLQMKSRRSRILQSDYMNMTPRRPGPTRRHYQPYAPARDFAAYRSWHGRLSRCKPAGSSSPAQHNCSG